MTRAMYRMADGQLDKHYSSWKTPRHQAPPASATDELYSLGSIVLLFRSCSPRISKTRADHQANSAKGS